MSNPLLELMRQGESGAAGYNAYNRGTYTGADGRQHIRGANGAIDFSQFTLGQVQDMQHLGRQDPDRVFAVGKYQIIPTTMDSGVNALNLDRNQRFTPALQDRIFSEYLIVDKRPAIQNYITGQPGASLESAQRGLALEWASFGDPDKGGRSHYGGANRASITLEQSASALNEMRTEYRTAIDRGVTPADAWRQVTASGQEQTQTPAAQQQRAQTPGQATGPGSYEDVMRVMLPPRNGVSPHVTSHYGAGRGDHNHGGSDFNYTGGQSGINLQHPTINSPIAGTVTFVGGQYGTVKIRDAQGNSHEILHTQSQSVVQGQQVTAGQPIGTMGGRGPDGANDYAQHVHYQLKDSNGRLQNPEQFWNNRQDRAVAPEARTQPAARANGAMSDGVLRFGEHGADVEGLQRSLNQLGIRDANGKPLKPDGDFGIHTREAVTAFQTANGLKVDGLAGRETLEAIGRKLPEGKVTVERAEVTGVTPQQPAARTPLISDPSHPNNALYTAIGAQLPAGTKPEVTANVTMQAMENGITSTDKLKGVVVKDGDAFVAGNNPGDRVKVDLSAPTPDLQQMSRHMQTESTQLQQQRTQPDPQVTQAR